MKIVCITFLIFLFSLVAPVQQKPNVIYIYHVSASDENGKLLPGFVNADSLVNGEARKRVMNYNSRLMMSTNECTNLLYSTPHGIVH